LNGGRQNPDLAKIHPRAFASFCGNYARLSQFRQFLKFLFFFDFQQILAISEKIKK